ncbi:MAG: SDR family NAD(P)-dependent oxidoreductase [Ignavibacteriales bacterium]|nr:SDR family NAD(P)-dependent oxidoreductase [Ignavibacteriales bacterium]MCF8305880.1 SDR family NAD(P)-dependent oxidoreductase [Ignavibacteriales bacterium]MCF8315601.1 SDR family NAD(P)-dependent oxidoreductase [Ignavibacteriales bacterium]MCF8437205.1 SDR family NAD(P)-dependent oxidoreductase [Ignavibacteriales bacterium]
MKILVTGATNGMGKGVSKILAGSDNQSHEIILLCRSEKSGLETIKEIENATTNKKLSLLLCDLAKLSDVRNAVNEIQNKHKSLDSVFINAGLGYAAGRVETEDGMDSHFQVNYLSQFMLTLNLLNLLENSENGGRIIFNVTRGGNIIWDDMQMKNGWGYEKGIHQAMAAKRMFLIKLHNLYKMRDSSRVTFIGFEISKTVWSNQINIIPLYMKTIATLIKFLGGFISIDECGSIMAPLFTESLEESLKRSGKFITWKKNKFSEIPEDNFVLDKGNQDRLWKASLALCNDLKTEQIAEALCN